MILGVKPGLERSDHALARQPLNAAFKAPKIIVAGSLVRTMFRDCLLVIAVGCLQRSKLIGLRFQGIKQTSQWGHHGHTPCRLPPLNDVSPLNRPFPG
jgi:hypothetical protein